MQSIDSKILSRIYGNDRGYVFYINTDSQIVNYLVNFCKLHCKVKKI